MVPAHAGSRSESVLASRGPLPAPERVAGCLNGSLRLRLAAIRDMADDGARGRIIDRDGLAGRRLAPCAADQRLLLKE